MEANFVHLRVHSEYSLVDGMVRVKPLLQRCVDFNMPAVAITDQCNLFAAVRFYRAAQAAGVKAILGADLAIQQVDDLQHPCRITVLCQNQQGYLNLTRLISKAYREGQYQGQPQVHTDWLAESSEGLIVLSGARDGDVAHALLAKKEDELNKRLAFWTTHFADRFYIEVQRTGRLQEESYLRAAMALADKHDLPVVATNGVRFIEQADYEAHEARVCIHQGYLLSDEKRPKFYSEQQFFRSPQAMCELFSDMPQALINSVNIAKRCNVSLDLGRVCLPDFPVPQGMSMESYLQQQSTNGLEHRFATVIKAKDSVEDYQQRLTTELDVINRMGFAGYFLIVADFIGWAKANDIPVGPGRGSGAGSLVAYALQITDLDPLQYDLLFERFLNPERISMPDFDIDFCMDGRDRVIDYVAEKYGRDSVSQIITFGTMAAKAVVRDVGRVLGYRYGYVDKIAKLIPFELGITLDKALASEEVLRKLYEEEEDTKTLIDLAKKLEGLARNAGKHAGGVVIAPSKLSDFCPIYCEQDSQQMMSQFDKDDVEAVGLVKFDFLGLRTLTIIKWALDMINHKKTEQGEACIDIQHIPMDDAKTFALLKACQSLAVFQLESRGMRDLIKRLQPDDFEEIIALVALFRPGPLQSGMVDDFIDRKHGRGKASYFHPSLEPILKPTYGIILYQEQVMQIAQVLSGYSLGGADLLRRAMGKKKPEEMAKQRVVFLDGADKNNIKASLANKIFDVIEKFAGYGFNRSHSAAYALLSYQTAWLKAHYPAQFMAAVLSSDMDNTDKVVMMVRECEAMGLKVIMPQLNRSAISFTVSEQGEVIFGLGAIKGVGEAALEVILKERDQAGSYQSLFDLCQRVDGQKVNRRVLEALIKSGALDQEGIDRGRLFASIDKAMKHAAQCKHDAKNKQGSLFASESMTPLAVVDYDQNKGWGLDEVLSAEKESLGFYVSGHPITRYQKELKRIVSFDLSRVQTKAKKKVLLAGMVVALRTMMTKRGDRMAFLTIEDAHSRIEVAVFSKVYQEYRELLIVDQLLLVEGEVSVDDYSGGYRMSANRLFTMNQAREIYAKALALRLCSEQLKPGTLVKLESLLFPYQGGVCPVRVYYKNKTAKASLRLGRAWHVRPEDALLDSLRQLLGPEAVLMGY